MADKTLPQLTLLTLPSTGLYVYALQGATSYRVTLDALSRLMLTGYGVWYNPITSTMIGSGNANTIINGLNTAPSAQLNATRISGIIDGGTF